MKYRILGKTGYRASEISLGTWQLGSRWGEPFDARIARETLEAALAAGIDLFDTADIYQGGESERAIGRFLKEHPAAGLRVVTKMGRALDPHTAAGYTAENMRRFVDGSRRRLGVEQLDLTLLHCPPTPVYRDGRLFDALDTLKHEGAICHYGVSVERIDEALAALDRDISAIEIIFNMFRLRPAEELFAKAAERNVGIIVRVPLASGLLTGGYTEHTRFGADDHRTYNRNGEAFDKGETFSGVDYRTGIEAARQLKAGLGCDDLGALALRWILMHPEVSVVIPGASRPEQIVRNAAASELPPLTEEQMAVVRRVYDERIRPLVHHLW